MILMTSATIPAKPRPHPNADSLPFWEGCARGELRYQHCTSCDRAQFPPRAFCARCQGPSLEWRQSARQGSIHTFTVVQRAPSAAFKGDVPYVIVLVDLDEGFRLMMNLRGAGAEAAKIGQRVRVVFEHAAGDYPLPQAEPA